MPEELSPQAENDLHELGWYKVGLSIENVKFIIQEAMKYPEDPTRIRVLIEQAVKGTVLGTAKSGEIEEAPIPLSPLHAPPMRVMQNRTALRPETLEECAVPASANIIADAMAVTAADQWLETFYLTYRGINGNSNREP